MEKLLLWIAIDFVFCGLFLFVTSSLPYLTGVLYYAGVCYSVFTFGFALSVMLYVLELVKKFKKQKRLEEMSRPFTLRPVGPVCITQKTIRVDQEEKPVFGS